MCVDDVLWYSHNITVYTCIIICVRIAELLASPKPYVCLKLTELKWWVVALIAC